ncbi:MAG TPA: Fic family protein [Terriglobia bacterium]|nr:Fic family protein [Terriglobia bacterium]
MVNSQFNGSTPAGYDALITRFKLQVIPNWHHSRTSQSNVRQTHTEDGQVIEIYPPFLTPEDSLAGHLEFALKYDGTNLEILCSVFEKAPEEELLAYIRSKPTGKYARRLWYLFELLTGKRLPVDDLTTANYVDLLEADEYYTAAPVQVRRQRINDNLLGDARFSPIVRRTQSLAAFEKKDLSGRCRQLLEGYPRDIMRRALSYLYTKETKSSFEIENVTLDASRTERFIALLASAEKKDFFAKPELIDLQNRIADERFREPDYRKSQNYVGESLARREKVHFVSPKPADLAALMEGMFAAHRRMEAGKIQAVIHAATVSFGFVYMHPFEDGNGRIHRFLIHNILARAGFTPPGAIFPVSAAMLQDKEAYDGALENFSLPLLPLVEYKLDYQGRMTVLNETALRYRFIDMTAQTEALFLFVERVIETDLVQELDFLRNYDAAKSAIQAIVDMPDRLIDLFIRLCFQNKGVLSASKRKNHFNMLTDEEVAQMQEAIKESHLVD